MAPSNIGLPGIRVEAFQTSPLKLFSVDVEDWFHNNFTSAPRLDVSAFERRVEVGVERLLDALAATGSRATFFVLGSVAEEHPALVKRIANAGHEIGSHALSHTLLYEQRPDEVARDLEKARALLQDLSGQPVLGFRAPSWSITSRNLWAIDAVAEAGFRYDSSIFPAENYMYGIRGAPVDPYRILTPAGNSLIEIPPATISLGPARFGVGGGFYLRVLPLWVHRRALRRALDRGAPFLAYSHPREFDPESWSLELPLDLREKLIHRVGLAAGAARARALLQLGGWSTLGNLLEAVSRPTAVG
jgi:polysaccharide deacetylase family protein (PEP-CTERM system associated)